MYGKKKPRKQTCDSTYAKCTRRHVAGSKLGFCKVYFESLILAEQLALLIFKVAWEDAGTQDWMSILYTVYTDKCIYFFLIQLRKIMIKDEWARVTCRGRLLDFKIEIWKFRESICVQCDIFASSFYQYFFYRYETNFSTFRVLPAFVGHTLRSFIPVLRN